MKVTSILEISLSIVPTYVNALVGMVGGLDTFKQ